MMMNVVIDEGAYVPEKAHAWDAGYDLRTPIDLQVPARGSAVVDTGVHMEIPEGFVGFLKSKSGLNVKKDLTSEGVIDAGYTGSIVVKLYNNGPEDRELKRGDKITQICFLRAFSFNLVEVDALGDTERGCHGFGSSGR